jgi:hypothetical protein
MLKGTIYQNRERAEVKQDFPFVCNEFNCSLEREFSKTYGKIAFSVVKDFFNRDTNTTGIAGLLRRA